MYVLAIFLVSSLLIGAFVPADARFQARLALVAACLATAVYYFSTRAMSS
ncbi:MAG: hypothetical protein M1396_03230 [Chloroflexi bacterium]|nr:hypothetical protein [Chloroflexota bacterium]